MNLVIVRTHEQSVVFLSYTNESAVYLLDEGGEVYYLVRYER